MVYRLYSAADRLSSNNDTHRVKRFDNNEIDNASYYANLQILDYQSKKRITRHSSLEFFRHLHQVLAQADSLVFRRPWRLQKWRHFDSHSTCLCICHERGWHHTGDRREMPYDTTTAKRCRAAIYASRLPS